MELWPLSLLNHRFKSQSGSAVSKSYHYPGACLKWLSELSPVPSGERNKSQKTTLQSIALLPVTPEEMQSHPSTGDPSRSGLWFTGGAAYGSLVASLAMLDVLWIKDFTFQC